MPFLMDTKSLMLALYHNLCNKTIEVRQFSTIVIMKIFNSIYWLTKIKLY